MQDRSRYARGSRDRCGTGAGKDHCTDWCAILLWIVPAKVEGTWRLPQGELRLQQQFQMVTGTLGGAEISEGRLRGNEITFKVASTLYEGRVRGNTMEGTVNGKPWSGSRER